MSIYDQIARGFNPGQGAVNAALYKKQEEQNALARQMQERQMGLQEKAYGLKAQRFEADQAQKLRENVAKAIAWADTPEKWQQAVQHYQSQGMQIPPEYTNVSNENFEQVRRSALASLMTPAQVADRVSPVPPKPTSLMLNLAAAGLEPGTPEYQSRIIETLNKPGVTVNTAPKLPTGFQWKDPNNLDAGVLPIRGGPKDPSAQPRSTAEATMISNSLGAQRDLNKAKNILFDKEGGLRRQEAVTGGANMPWTEGREARQAMRRTVEVILRMRTGAAAPETEVSNYMDLYYPSPFDSDEAAQEKVNRLEEFFQTTLDQLKAGELDWQKGEKSSGQSDLTPEEQARYDELKAKLGLGS